MSQTCMQLQSLTAACTEAAGLQHSNPSAAAAPEWRPCTGVPLHMPCGSTANPACAARRRP